MFVGRERKRADAVQAGIDGANCGEVQRLARMLPLVVAQRNQALPPVQIAVGEQAPTVFRLHENIEVCQIVGRIAQDIGCVQDQREHQHSNCGAMLARVLPYPTGDE